MGAEDAPVGIMSDDLIQTLDDAAVLMLEKALEGANFEQQFECFKIVAAWTERRAKLKPDEKSKGGEKFAAMRESLNGTRGNATQRRGNRTKAASGETRSSGAGDSVGDTPGPFAAEPGAV